MNDIYFGEEDARYVKKKPKRPHIKEKHKHNYDQYCVGISTEPKHLTSDCLIQYCGECGKVKNIIFNVFDKYSDTIKRLKKQGRTYNIDGINIFSLKYIPIPRGN